MKKIGKLKINLGITLSLESIQKCMKKKKKNLNHKNDFNFYSQKLFETFHFPAKIILKLYVFYSHLAPCFD